VPDHPGSLLNRSGHLSFEPPDDFFIEHDMTHDLTWQAVKANKWRAQKAEKEDAKMKAGKIVYQMQRLSLNC
jgi:hypothetical protein